MFARRLVVSLFLGALLAGSTAGVSAAGGYKIPGVILLPPLVNVPLPLAVMCNTTEATRSSPATTRCPTRVPRRTRRRRSSPTSPKGSCKLTAYSDGDVLILCRYKGEVVFT